jgi:hypothetical protein
MAKGDLSIDEDSLEKPILLSPFGRKFTESDIESARQERTVDGTLRKDIRWQKKNFRLVYDMIAGDALDDYIEIQSLQTELSLIVARSDDSDDDETYTVQMKPFERTRMIMLDDGIWSGVTIEFEEV